MIKGGTNPPFYIGEKMKKTAYFLVVILVLCLFSGCEVGKQKYTDYTFDYFDTVTTIIGYETDNDTFQKNLKEIKEQLEEYHKLFDIYNSYDGINNLYTVNSRQKVTADEKIIDLLEFSKEMYNKTNGKVNIAMGSVLEIWHDYRTEGKELPPQDLLKKANGHTNIDNIVIEENTVYLSDSEMLLDVGAIAKGYSAQKVAEWMKSKGLDGYILNIGGNVCTIGGKNWKVAIEDPDDTKAHTEVLTLNGGKALVTSGSYQRFYTVDGKNYHHIIDPVTLMPASYFKSVSVLCDDSAIADSLSTALFCMSYEDGIRILKNFKNIEVMWIKTDGTKLYTEGFKKQ